LIVESPKTKVALPEKRIAIKCPVKNDNDLVRLTTGSEYIWKLYCKISSFRHT